MRISETVAAKLHIPVLLPQVLEALQPHSGGRYLDATLGLGGHAEAILKSAAETELCGLDRDGEALQYARERLKAFGSRAHFFHLPFAEVAQALEELSWSEVDGVLADLGISSLQIDKAERGFSFLASGPLDMRMNQDNRGRSAADLVNRMNFDELKKIIQIYGEEPQAGRIAKYIIRERQKSPITDTLQLADIVRNAYPPVWRKKARRHPATRTFQALRIAVNEELAQLERFLNSILAYIKPGGRLAIISFHSLEDRIVKNTMRRWAQACICPPSQPFCNCDHKPEVRILYKKPLVADLMEVAENPRSSSARLRAIEKLADA